MLCQHNLLCSRTNPSGCVCASSLRNMDAFSLDWLSRPGGDTNLLIMFVSLCLFLSTTLPPFWHVVDHILAKWLLYFLGCALLHAQMRYTMWLTHVFVYSGCLHLWSTSLAPLPLRTRSSHLPYLPPARPRLFTTHRIRVALV